MLPDQPWLVKCQHCGALVWIDEQEVVGEVEPWDCDEDTFKDARSYVIPSIQDYFVILEQEVSDSEKVKYLRLRAWWAGNDARRRTEDDTCLSDDEVANLRAFAALLDECDENDRITKAEVMRELGEYQDAITLLSERFGDELAQAAAMIKGLAVQKILTCPLLLYHPLC